MLLFVGAAAFAAAVAMETLGHWQTGLRPQDSSYAAMVYTSSALTGQIAAAVAIMALFAIARHLVGRLDAVRRGTFETTALLAHYGAAQGLAGLVLIHGFPRVVG